MASLLQQPPKARHIPCSHQHARHPHVLPPFLQLLNGVMERACAAGAPAAAQAAYSHMCRAGVAPTPDTFGALLAALRRQHSVAEVAEAALGLAQQAAEAPGGGAAATQAVLAACAARGWHDVSLALLEGVEAAGVAPTLEQVDSALAACAAAGAAADARRAFACLARHGLQPSPASRLHLAQALVASGQWVLAVQEYQALVQAG